MTKEYRTIETEVRLPYRLAYGETWTRFFEGMKAAKLLGSKCRQCQRVLVPARTFCPRCFVDTDEWLECSQEGIVVAWVLTNYRYFAQPIEPPFISALIKLDGTDVNFLHLIGGFDLTDMETVRRKVWNGMKVKAVWEEERLGHILDIKYFAPM
ncbi:MAG: Zn-ribbon domain-containing OB-fold protein [Thermodesulfobacteriota bacterium]